MEGITIYYFYVYMYVCVTHVCVIMKTTGDVWAGLRQTARHPAPNISESLKARGNRRVGGKWEIIRKE